MKNTTYTAKGTFDSNGNVSVQVCIPAEPSPGDYIIEKYNISKRTTTGVINAIFCFFSNRSENPIQHSTFDYLLNFDLNSLLHYQDAIPFDTNNEDALFLFFHNDNFDLTEIKYQFDNLENTYIDVKVNGNQSQVALATNATLNNPRRIGMSLILKPNSAQ